MSDKFPIDEAQIVGLFMECVFYGACPQRRLSRHTHCAMLTDLSWVVCAGMYLVTFGMCMRALLFTQTFALKDRRDIRWAMVVVALLMFIFSNHR